MEDKIINRLFIYLQSKEIPHTRFEKEAGLSNGYLKIQLRRNADLGESVINKIIKNCLDVNIIWLLTGEGDMLKNVTPICNPNLKPQSTENVTPIVTPNEKNTFNPSDPKFTANFSADDENNGCPLCAEKERLINALNEIIKSKDAIIRTKDDVIRCQNEYIDKLSEKREGTTEASAS